MSVWKEYRIEEIAEKIGMGPFGSNIKVETFVQTGIPIISGTHLKGIKLVDKEYNFISEEHAKKLKSSNVFRGDVIFTHAGNIDQVSFIPQNSKYDRYVLSQRQFFLRCNKEKILPEYITYYFKTREGQHQLLANTSSTGVPSIAQPVSYLKSISVLIPDTNEQIAIVSILSSLDDKIDLLHRQNKTLEALAETLFRQWFVEQAEKKWEPASLYDAIEIVGGGTPKKEMPELWNGDIKWISGKDTTQNHKQFITETEKKITVLGLESSATKILPRFATVISARGTVGTYCILAEPMAFSQTSYGIKPKFSDCFFFTYLLIAHSVEELKAASYGSIFDTITTNTFREQSIKIPSEPEIQTFEKKVKPYFNKMLSNQTQIRTLTQLRDTLLPKLMSGEVRVKEFVDDTTTTRTKTSIGTIYTIGHSNHTIDKFISLLKKHDIKVVADVRSTPYSRLHPQFNREVLKKALNASKIQYVFMGNELGARPNDPSVYVNNAVQYARLAERIDFRNGIERLIKGINEHKIALMCTEKDPINCHRTILVGRNLKKLGATIQHILYNSELEENSKTEERLIKMEGFTPTLFNTNIDQIEIIEKVYDKRSTEIAYIREPEEEKYGRKK